MSLRASDTNLVGETLSIVIWGHFEGYLPSPPGDPGKEAGKKLGLGVGLRPKLIVRYCGALCTYLTHSTNSIDFYSDTGVYSAPTM